MEKLDLNNIQDYLEKAEDFDASGKEWQAIEIYSDILKIDPKNVIALCSRGNSYNFLGDYHNAVADLDSANKIDPNNCGILYSRAIVYANLCDHNKALEDLNLASKINPNSFTIYFRKAESNYYIGNYHLSIKDSECGINLLKKYLDSQKGERPEGYILDNEYMYRNSYVIRGHAYVALEDFENSISNYTHAINIVNQYITNEYISSPRSTGKIVSTSSDLNNEIEPISVHQWKWISSQNYHLFCFRGFAYFESRDLEKALKDFTFASCLVLNPIKYDESRLKETPLEEISWDLEPYFYLGRVNFDLGNYKEAISLYDWLDIIDKCKEATKKGNIRSRHSDDWNEWAIALSFEQRGLSYYYLEQYEQSLKDLVNATSIYKQCDDIASCQRIEVIIKSIDEIKLVSTKLISEGFYIEASEEISKERTTTSIVRRMGQPKFRQDLLEAYGYRCAITGCSSVEVLEAAHIIFYNETQNNLTTNGLLLRADIHTLFDRDLISINPDTLIVNVAPNLLRDYGDFHNKPLRLPTHKQLRPNIEALKSRYARYQIQTNIIPSVHIRRIN